MKCFIKIALLIFSNIYINLSWITMTHLIWLFKERKLKQEVFKQISHAKFVYEDMLLDPGKYTGSTANRMLSSYVMNTWARVLALEILIKIIAIEAAWQKVLDAAAKLILLTSSFNILEWHKYLYLYKYLNICISNFVPNHQKTFVCLVCYEKILKQISQLLQ